jgi:hypothetical protein
MHRQFVFADGTVTFKHSAGTGTHSLATPRPACSR